MRASELVASAVAQGGLGSDALLEAVLPLCRQVAELHARGLVAPLRGIDRLEVDERSRLRFPVDLAARPVQAPGELRARERRTSDAIEVVGHHGERTDLGRGAAGTEQVVAEPTPGAIAAPVLVPGWQSWEHVVGHHDPLTDIFGLGQLLVGLGCGLDLGRTEDVARLLAVRGNLHALAPGLHPVIASCAAQMAEPDRHRRAQDLLSMVGQLENYRDQPLDFDVAGVTHGSTDRRAAVLGALRDRLFDLSRRNRLVSFRPTAQSLNLTESSVPLMLDVRNIRAEQLFTWNDELAKRFLGGTAQSLGRWLRYDEAPYTASTLDTLISTARRDRAEYGQDQLRLVPAFLRWHDLRNDPTTRLSSPLLLLPVELTKKRGVRDSYRLRVTDPVAEVNPTLRQHLHQLYRIELPRHVDLSEPGAIANLHAHLSAEITRTEPGLVLHLRERPRIDLVRHQAMLRLRSYRRRQHDNRAGEFAGRPYTYSYRRSDYQPLGVQIFRTRLGQQDLPLGVVLGDVPPVRRPGAAAESVDTELYTLDSGETAGPYSWDLDLCGVTLASFSYRTLGLVRDYDDLLAEPRPAAAFDQLFSDEPRPLSPEPAELPIADRHLVVAADGSQTAAVARARRGESFVIQGPPGTGKSQTITNLIADFVARGRRVLFVCQKRAALDVVHSRLAGRGLDELCTLIHDSQADKKSFVHGLRDTYEGWLTAADDAGELTARRDRLVARTETLLGDVGRYEALLAAAATDAGPAAPAPDAPAPGPGPADGGVPSLRTVVNRLVELRDQRWDGLAPEQRRLLPDPADWWRSRAAVAAVSRALAAGGGTEVLARSPLRAVAGAVWAAPGADAEIPVRATRARDAWAAVAAAVDALPAVPAADLHDVPLQRLRAVAGLGRLAAPLAERGRAGALRAGSPAAQALREAVSQHLSAVAAADAAWQRAAGWREPLSPADTRSALAVAQSKEGSLFSFLSSPWRSVKRLVADRFDLSSRAVRPRVTDLLSELLAAHDAGAVVAAGREQARRDWGTDDLAALGDEVDRHARSSDTLVAAWAGAIAGDPTPSTAQALARLAGALDSADAAGSGFLTADLDTGSLATSRRLVGELASPQHTATIQALVPAMRALGTAPVTVQTAVRSLDAAPEQLEYAVCAAHWDRARGAAPLLGELTSRRLRDVVAELAAAQDELTDVNAALVVAGVRSRFLAELAHAGLSVTGMSDPDRARKKTFSTGRRELEHEFGKVMRYKSIRDLASGASGSVVALLRPVWLMSPSSVSDTLPLDGTFDVVVYDEASQIPIEEAIPAMHRAPQVIVVGDQMQLPPTQYFRVGTPDGDLDEDDEQVGVVLTEDSFLAISALRLASTMLTWHYRSRSEALISFSNAAFYGGRLATIPDRLPARTGSAWPVRATPPEGPVGPVVDAILSGSITTVRVTDGVYLRRTNPAEATWIAAAVRELLLRETGASIGIVAFSEAQQGEIERALERLAHTDPDFATQYEAELVRTHGEQDVGLFVKNLENVQGDERDIVIMSVCYAAGPDGRMLMNFGPINTAGGEKRLNVIFSRARRHMVIVSSIEPEAITNTYNDGANTLRRFLGYADAVSCGDVAAARSALAPYAVPAARGAGPRADAGPAGSGDAGADRAAVVDQLATALRERGIEVRADVGESAFRCDLALRRPGDTGHRVAVLVDTPQRVAADTVLERLGTHHHSLRATGWIVADVLTTDWIHNPDEILTTLQSLLTPQD